MTDLQTGLLILGLLVVAGVVLYNKIQERAATRRADRSFRSSHEDALLGEIDARREPTLDSAETVSPKAPAAPSVSLPDPRLDFVIELDLPQPVPGTKLLEDWAEAGHRFAQRELLAASDDGEAWMRPTARDTNAYQRVRAGLQLVTRQGPIGEGELIEFRSGVETLAARLGAVLSSPEMKQAMETARELDRLCADNDVQVVIHVVAPPGAALRGTKIRSVAESAGFALEGDGRFALRDAEGRLLYALSARDGARFAAQAMKSLEVQGVSLAMDMPRAPDTERTYDAMVRFARQLGSLLGGSLVDDNGNPLDERSLAAIGAQLQSIRKALEAKGFAPGTAAAQRLFS